MLGDTDSESKRLAVGGGGGTLTKVSQCTSHVIQCFHVSISTLPPELYLILIDIYGIYVFGLLCLCP